MRPGHRLAWIRFDPRKLWPRLATACSLHGPPCSGPSWRGRSLHQSAAGTVDRRNGPPSQRFTVATTWLPKRLTALPLPRLLGWGIFDGRCPWRLPRPSDQAPPPAWARRDGPCLGSSGVLKHQASPRSWPVRGRRFRRRWPPGADAHPAHRWLDRRPSQGGASARAHCRLHW